MLFLVAVVSAYSQFTDADLFDQEAVKENTMQATTLDFAALDTVNQSGKKLFFSLSGLLPTGFHVETVRIKNEGQMEYPFIVTASQTAGSPALCQQLELLVMRDWKPVYTGKLLDLQALGQLQKTETWEDLVFVVSLPTAGPELKMQSCAFSFTFTSQADTPFFHDTETLDNMVSTGSWAD